MYMWVIAILYVKYNWILCNSFIQMILLKQCSFQFINFRDIPVIKWSKTFRVFSICEESTEIRKNKLLIIFFYDNLFYNDWKLMWHQQDNVLF